VASDPILTNDLEPGIGVLAGRSRPARRDEDWPIACVSGSRVEPPRRPMPTWNASLAIGHEDIDAQHQELFARADALLEAMRSGASAREVKPLLAFLDEYCSGHFASEERLMRARGYAGLDEHLAQHGNFVKQFEIILAQFELKGASPTVTISLQQLICGWLVKHIGAIDKQLARFLEGQRSR
jgi:hemerythrin